MTLCPCRDDEINRYHENGEAAGKQNLAAASRSDAWTTNDFGYLIEHLYGRDGIAYEDYEYSLPKKKLKRDNTDKAL